MIKLVGLALFYMGVGNSVKETKVQNEDRVLGIKDTVPEAGVCWKLFKDQAHADNPDPSCWEHIFSKITTSRQFDPNSTSAHFALAVNFCKEKQYLYVQFGACDPYTLQRNPILPCGFFDACRKGRTEFRQLLDGYGFAYCLQYSATPENTEVWQFGTVPKDYTPPVEQNADICFGNCALSHYPVCLPSLSLDQITTTKPRANWIDYAKVSGSCLRLGALITVIYGFYQIKRFRNQPIEMATIGQQEE